MTLCLDRLVVLYLALSLLRIVTKSRHSQIAECHLIISQYICPSPVRTLLHFQTAMNK